MERVIVESPYAASTEAGIELNEAYGEISMHDCLINYNESPYASHLLYTRRFVLHDKILAERKLGIRAGFCWRNVTDRSVFYIDFGITSGMEEGINDCREKNKPFQLRRLPENLWNKLVVFSLERGIEIKRSLRNECIR